MADVLAIMQLVFQQFYEFDILKVPQIEFIDRVLDIPVVTQEWVLTVQTVQRNVKIPQVQCLGKVADVPVVVQRQVPWRVAWWSTLLRS